MKKKITQFLAVLFVGLLAQTANAAVTYELNGGVTNDYGWTNGEEMYQALAADVIAAKDGGMAFTFASDFGTGKTRQTFGTPDVTGGTGVAKDIVTFDLAFFTTAPYAAKWGWLASYLDVKNSAAKKEAATLGSANMRYSLAAFFANSQRTGNWPTTADYTSCGVGTLSAYMPTWKHSYVNLTNPTKETSLYGPYYENKFFIGWYDNSEFNGVKVTLVNANTNATLYARYESQRITYVLNGGVTNDYGWTNGEEMYQALAADVIAAKDGGMAFSFASEFGTGKKRQTFGTPDVTGSTGVAFDIQTFDLTFFTGDNVYATKWKWLGDYLDAKNQAAKYTKPTTNSAYMRYALAAFFSNNVRASYPETADYTSCGVSTLSAYMPTWQHSYANPVDPKAETMLFEPYCGENFFDGWYDNSGFKGEKVTMVGSNTADILYARIAPHHITYVLNEGVTNDYGWITGEEMYQALAADVIAAKDGGMAFSFASEFGTGKKRQTFGTPDVTGSTGVALDIQTFDLTFFTGDNVYATKWKWLGDYLDAKNQAAKYTKPTTSSAYMRYALAAFFSNSVRASYPETADYTSCGVGTLSAYMPTWQHSYDNPGDPTKETTLFEPYCGDFSFGGWFDNPAFTGEPYTTVDQSTFTTLYANVVTERITYELNGGVTNDYGWTNGEEMYQALAADVIAAKGAGLNFGFASSFGSGKKETFGPANVNGNEGVAFDIQTFDLTFFTTAPYAAKWGWLKQYLDAKNSAAGKEAASKSSGNMRYSLAAFFANSQRTSSYLPTADYTSCGVGTLSAYMPTWQHSYANPGNPTQEVTLVTPYHTTLTFEGWYNNPQFTGDKFITVDQTTIATLYAHYVESKPDPQAYEQKMADAKYNRNMTITNNWMYSVNLGNWDNNKPNVNSANESRGMAVKDGKVYILWRDNSTPTVGNLKLRVYNASSGEKMEDVALKNYVFQQPTSAPAGGVWDYSKFTAGLISYPHSAMGMDNAGHIIVANLVTSGHTYQIWKIDPETGDGELVVYMGGNSGIQDLAARFSTSGTIRLDHFAVSGDVDGNASIVAACQGSNRVYKFNIVDGAWDGDVTEIICKNGTNAAAEGISFGSLPNVAFATDGNAFYVDGGDTWPERFDFSGNMQESFKGVKDANDQVVRPSCYSKLHHSPQTTESPKVISGCHEFKVGEVNLFAIGGGSYGGTYTPHGTTKIFVFQDDNKHFDEMIPVWEVPEMGFGNVTNDQLNQYQQAVEVDDKTTELYIYVPANGLAKYTIAVHGIGVTLDENGTEEAIEDLVGEVANVRTGRTFQKNSTNHTICLPFSLDEAAFAASALAAGCTKLEEFVSAEIVNKGEVNETLVLNMNPVEPKAIEAGKPYIIAWADDAEEIPTPLFEQVTIATATPTPVKDNEHSVSFCGTFIPKSVTAGDKGILFVGATGDLFWPNVSGNIKGLRCYFTIDLDKAGTAIYRGMAAKLGEDRNAPMSVENTSLSKQEWSETARKLIEQGRVVIISNGERFDMNGRKL